MFQKVFELLRLYIILRICIFLQYPYIPAHITKPKEHKRLFLVQLPEKGENAFSLIIFSRTQ